MKSMFARTATRSQSWVCRRCQTRSLQSPHLLSQTTFVRHSSNRTARLPESPARTRFAPSPTGNLHLGSLRTALYNYLLAKRTNGQFLLRIEDTDQKRTVPGAEQKLLEDLQWAGLQWDEGPMVGGPHGPYKQSERNPIYHQHAKTLLRSNAAYRCFCSAERIDGLNRLRHEKGLPLGYDRKCADLPAEHAEDRAHGGEAYVVRFRVPKQYPRFNDLVYGKTGHGAEKVKKMQLDEPVYDDPILLKSDGFPTYHFANVVDDQLMKITHVIRGSEWMSSTPLHVALYEALGWIPPAFGHVPLLVDHNRQKLSKRNFDTDLESYKKRGFYADALVNFTSLLGWSHQQKSDVMDLKDLEAVFDLKFTKGNTVVEFDKLAYLQTQHARRRIKRAGPAFEQMVRDVAQSLLETFGAAEVRALIGERQLRDVVAAMLQTETIASSLPSDHATHCSVFLESVQSRPPLTIEDTSFLPSLRVAAATLCLVPKERWVKDVHRANLAMLEITDGSQDAVAKKRGKKELYHYLRWALLGGRAGPSIPEVMEILGREISESRIREAALVTKELENMATKPLVSFGHSEFAVR